METDEKQKGGVGGAIITILAGIGVAAIIFGIYSFVHWYTPHQNYKKGFVVVDTFNCPDYHSIKANLNSGIYHVPFSTYYSRTNAANGECFDTAEHAEAQGFRAPYN